MELYVFTPQGYLDYFQLRCGKNIQGDIPAGTRHV